MGEGSSVLILKSVGSESRSSRNGLVSKFPVIGRALCAGDA